MNAEICLVLLTTMTTSKIPPPNGDDGDHNPTSLPPAALDLASRIFDMARQGDTEPLSSYLSAGIPPNLTNSSGDTLLMLAAYHGRTSTVTALLEHGADVNALNGRGQSPLAGSVFKDYQEVVKVLMDKGADVKIGRPDAMQSAGMFGRRECAELMGVSWEECIGCLPEGVTIGPHGDQF